MTLGWVSRMPCSVLIGIAHVGVADLPSIVWPVIIDIHRVILIGWICSEVFLVTIVDSVAIAVVGRQGPNSWVRTIINFKSIRKAIAVCIWIVRIGNIEIVHPIGGDFEQITQTITIAVGTVGFGGTGHPVGGEPEVGRRAGHIGVDRAPQAVGGQTVLIQVEQSISVQIIQRIILGYTQSIGCFPIRRHSVTVNIYIHIERVGVNAIRDAVTVGIGILRVGSCLILSQVRQSILIGICGSIIKIRIKIVIDFPAVRHAIAIGVRIMGIGAVSKLISIRYPVAIRIRILWIGRNLHRYVYIFIFILIFLEVRQAIVIGILICIIHQRVQAIIDFPLIRHAIIVGVGFRRIGSGIVFKEVGQFIAVRITIRIIRQWIQGRRILNFPRIRHAVIIGIRISRIGSGQCFFLVTQSVIISIRIVWIRTVIQFAIDKPINIHIGSTRIRIG